MKHLIECVFLGLIAYALAEGIAWIAIAWGVIWGVYELTA